MALSPSTNHELAEKSAYLNVNFFWVRTVFYFLLFGVGALLLRGPRRGPAPQAA
jgi:hypothetical protein